MSDLDEVWRSSVEEDLGYLVSESIDADILYTFFIESVERFITEKATPRFWSNFREYDIMKSDLDEETLSFWLETQLISAVNELEAFIQIAKGVLNSLNVPQGQKKRASAHIGTLCRLCVLKSPYFFKRIMKAFFQRHFLAFSEEKAQELEEGEESTVQSDRAIAFQSFSETLHNLQVVSLCEEMFTDVLNNQILGKIKSDCDGSFDVPLLESILGWVDVVVLQFLGTILQQSDVGSELGQWKYRFHYYAYESFARFRIANFFNIIVEFPDSIPALEDLKESLQQTKLYGELIDVLSQTFRTRLLQPAATTAQLIAVYIRTIKALRTLDPSGVLLQQSTQEVKAYMRDRADTLRTIVGLVTAEGEDSLMEELEANEAPIMIEGADDVYESEDEDNDSFLKWNPKPTTAQPDGDFSSARILDTISMLVNIYGNKDMFVEEYTTLLADRLLAATDFNTDKEVRNVELLKLKFGDASLQNCEIMLRDLADSKRVNNFVKGQLAASKAKADEDEENRLTESEVPFGATLLSHLFWPGPLKSEPVGLPAVIQKEVELFSKEFGKLKGSRKLEWIEQLGFVDLELEFDGETIEYQCSPAQASIIMEFQDNTSWTLSSLASHLNESEEAIRKRLGFWLNNGVIKEVKKNTFQSISSLSELNAEEAVQVEEEEASSAEEAEEDFSMAVPFIVAMLTNLGTLSLSRIHDTLVMMVPGYGGRTLQQSAQLLKSLVQEEKIELIGNEYQLKK